MSLLKEFEDEARIEKQDRAVIGLYIVALFRAQHFSLFLYGFWRKPELHCRNVESDLVLDPPDFEIEGLADISGCGFDDTNYEILDAHVRHRYSSTTTAVLVIRSYWYRVLVIAETLIGRASKSRSLASLSD